MQVNKTPPSDEDIEKLSPLEKEIYLKQAHALKEQEKEKELAPLFLFLTSALNVELVYVILKGITQFSLLNFVKDGLTRD